MKRSIRIVGCIVLSAALAAPAWAKKGGGGSGKGGGGESQAGGLPALEDRVDAIDTEITTLMSEVSGIGTLTTDVTTLMNEVADLEGQNNFAVVSAACAITSGSTSAVSATPVSAGECEVTFSKDVAACSSVATIVGAMGEVSVMGGVMKTVAGDSVDVFTDVPAGTPTSEAFNLTVTCP